MRVHGAGFARARARARACSQLAYLHDDKLWVFAATRHLRRRLCSVRCAEGGVTDPFARSTRLGGIECSEELMTDVIEVKEPGSRNGGE